MKLNELRDEAYRIACEHGWHEEDYPDEHGLMLVVTEISEAVEADRRNRHDKSDYYKKRVENSIICKGLDPEIPKERGYQAAFEEAIKDTVEDELADVVIRCLDLAGLRKFDLLQDMTVSPTAKHYIESMSFTEWAFGVTGTVTDAREFLAVECAVRRVVYEIYAYSTVKGFDLEWHVKQKMRYNEHRPYKHGKEY